MRASSSSRAAWMRSVMSRVILAKPSNWPLSILDRVDHHVGQEAAAVLAHAPGFGLIPAIAGGDFERLLRHIRSAVLLGVEAREVLAYNLVGAVALDALRTPGSSW